MPAASRRDVGAARVATQELGGSGRGLITAIIAGFEVMYRIGRAAKHSNERRGFYAAGDTGPFSAAVTRNAVAA
jgi:2-methylcitrate dehydratase PrpD